MRGADTFTESLFMMRHLEDFVPADHPLRPIRAMVNEALVRMDSSFAGMYEPEIKGGRPSIAPEKLLRAMLLQVFYSVRSERQLMEQTQYNLLFRWFIGLAMDDSVWVPTVFTKNRERLIEHDAIIELFNLIVETAGQKGWLSGEHFSVDGSLIQAWASHKSFVRKDGKDQDGDGKDNGDQGGKSEDAIKDIKNTDAEANSKDTSNNSAGADFKGQTRSNATHESSTDADARLYRKGKTASELRFMGHTLSDNRHGLIANAMVTQADGYAEREAAKVMIKAACEAAGDETINITLGADKGYDAKEFIDACLEMGVTPHVAQNTSGRRSAVPDAIAATTGYAISQNKRKLIEQGFGWAKTIGRIRQVMVRGLQRVYQVFVLTMAAYNLTRMRTLGQIRAQTA